MIASGFESFLDRFRQEAIAFYGNRLITIAVFGSVGRGTPRPDSDIDLLLVSDPLPNGRMNRVQEFAAVEDRLEGDFRALKALGIDTYLAPVFKTPEEVALGSPLFLDMIDGSKIVYDKDDFFRGYLDGLRVKLESLGARKVMYRGAWYWDLKPGFKRGEVIDL